MTNPVAQPPEDEFVGPPLPPIDAYSAMLGDWRLAVAAWAMGMGDEVWPRAKALSQMTVFRTDDHEFSFQTASAAALHLNAAWKAARRAVALRRRLTLDLFHTGDRAPVAVSIDGTQSETLFDYFEEMIAVAFSSYAAIEAFCNREIVDHAKGTIEVRKKGKTIQMSPEEAARGLSTIEKLKRVLPEVLGVPTPAGKQLWERFLEVEQLRNSVTHFKRHDEARRAESLHEPTPLFTLFVIDPFSMPEHAMALIRHFRPGDQDHRWMRNPSWKRSPE